MLPGFARREVFETAPGAMAARNERDFAGLADRREAALEIDRGRSFLTQQLDLAVQGGFARGEAVVPHDSHARLRNFPSS